MTSRVERLENPASNPLIDVLVRKITPFVQVGMGYTEIAIAVRVRFGKEVDLLPNALQRVGSDRKVMWSSEERWASYANNLGTSEDKRRERVTLWLELIDREIAKQRAQGIEDPVLPTNRLEWDRRIKKEKARRARKQAENQVEETLEAVKKRERKESRFKVVDEPFAQALRRLAIKRGLGTRLALGKALGKTEGVVTGSWFLGGTPSPRNFEKILKVLKPEGEELDLLVKEYGAKRKTNWQKRHKHKRENPADKPVVAWIRERCWRMGLSWKRFAIEIGMNGNTIDKTRYGLLRATTLAMLLERAPQRLNLSEEEKRKLAQIAETEKQTVVYNGSEAAEILGITRQWLSQWRKRLNLPLFLTREHIEFIKAEREKSKERRKLKKDLPKRLDKLSQKLEEVFKNKEHLLKGLTQGEIIYLGLLLKWREGISNGGDSGVAEFMEQYDKKKVGELAGKLKVQRDVIFQAFPLPAPAVKVELAVHADVSADVVPDPNVVAIDST